MKQNNKLRYLSIIINILLICLIIYKLKYFENINNFENENENENKNENENENENGKIAFLFLTYSNLKRPDIWNRFFDDKNSNKFTIYNHAKENEKVTNLILKDKHIPEHIETCWGCPNLVEANLLMMKQALRNKKNKKFILVSDSCIPIVSFNIFYNEIMKDNKTKINIYENNKLENYDLDRYDTINEPPFKKNEFIKHSGSGLVFNLKHTQMLVSNLDTFIKNWKNAYIPDEHYFGSILRVLDTNFNINYENYNITFDIWSKNKLTETNLNDTDIITDGYLNINKITNKAIDEIRDKKFLLIRKVDGHTEIDVEHLLI